MKKSHLSFIFLFLLPTAEALSKQEQELNIYSFRQQEIIAPVVSAFEQQTGIRVNVVHGKSHYLLSRLAEDGVRSHADVLLTSDLAQLNHAHDLLQPFEYFEQLTELNPDLYDQQRYWVSVSIRGRALFSSADTRLPIPQSFSQLSKPMYQGQLCIRDWQHSYNTTLIRTLKATQNADDIAWLQSKDSLLAKRPSGGDRDQLKALAQGKCQFAFANHYYFEMLKASDNKKDQKVTSQLTLHWLKTSQGSTPVSTTTVAITRHSPNVESANRFVQFLLTETTQQTYAESLFEFPVIHSKQGQFTQQYSPFIPALDLIKPALLFK
ncbi:hypothetical protein PULV_a2339 [Pseudoalteromonas ulvae UL12]|uniref:extracellular solute-binding protein n=1 Tax=Pseudoalteromonas ulvae TaxID=107327 RepID=UPI00186B8CD2|nr:extracellular solute-binding protein [Pseudoalteromonas ulvae]MBE0364610.1 hypothetical protein [Pseudoalteromonas ulvae UL12]